MAPSTFDFIVVGAGPSGCSLASGIAKSASKPSVLLLEAGGDASDPLFGIPADHLVLWRAPRGVTVNHGYESTEQPQLNGRFIPYTRGKGLGGSSLNNFCVWDYGSKQDMDEWAALVEDEAWRWDNVVKKFQQVENYHDATPEEFKKYIHSERGAHGIDGPLDITVPSRWTPGLKLLLDAAQEYGLPLNPDLSNDQGIGLGVVVQSCYKGRRVTASSAYLSANKPENLTVITGAPTTRVLFEGNKAIGVEVLNGTKYFATKEVILSAGSIDSPKILLLSGIGPAEELNKHHIPIIANIPGIGKGLRDHTLIRQQRLLKPGFVPDPPKYDRETEEQRWLADHAAGPLGEDKAYMAIGYLKFDSDISTWPEFQSISEQEKVLMMKPDVPDFELSIRIEPTGPGGALVCSAGTISMHAQSRGSVTLRSGDPKDPPLIDLQYLSHAYDTRAMVEALRQTVNFVEQSTVPTGELVFGPTDLGDEGLSEYVKSTIEPVMHAMGTVKMGNIANDDSCVDKDFRVSGVKGLRVVDMSVCPVVPCNHTQSTAYLIGTVAAEKIVSEHRLDELR